MGTVEKLRVDIDRGRARDKIPGSDPAAVPLGADDEAAGTPVTSERVDIARRQEIDSGPRTLNDGGALPYIVSVIIIAVILAGAVVYFMR